MLVGVSLKLKESNVVVPYWNNLLYIEAENEDELIRLTYKALLMDSVLKEYSIVDVVVIDDRSELLRHSDMRCFIRDESAIGSDCFHYTHDKFLALHHKIFVTEETANLKKAVKKLAMLALKAIINKDESFGTHKIEVALFHIIEEETMLTNQDFISFVIDSVKLALTTADTAILMNEEEAADSREYINNEIATYIYHLILERMNSVKQKILNLEPDYGIANIYDIPITECREDACPFPDASSISEMMEYIGTHKNRIAVKDDFTGVYEDVWLSDLPNYRYIHWLFRFIAEEKVPFALHGAGASEQALPTIKYCSVCGEVPIKECYVSDAGYLHRCSTDSHNSCYDSEEDYKNIEELEVQ